MKPSGIHLEVPNQTRKQLLDELAAAQSRLNELESGDRDSWNRVEGVPASAETYFAHLFKDAKIANLLFDPQCKLVSINPLVLGSLNLADYQDKIRTSLFESGYRTAEVRARVLGGEVLRVHITLDRNIPGPRIRKTGPEADGVVHLECTISSLGQQGYLVQAHDVTTEVQSKAALREREKFFRSVFQAIPYPSLVWKYVGSRKFTLHFYNASARELSQGNLAEFEGIDLDEFYVNVPEFARRVRTSFQTGEPATSEQRVTWRTTGEERYVRITSARVGHEYVIESMTDLTELKRTQEALAENEARFRRLLDNVPDVVYRLALKPEIRYEYISPAATAVTDYTPEELMMDLGFASTRIDPIDLAEPATTIDEIPAVGTPRVFRWLHKDGRTIWLEHRYVLVYDENGEPAAIEGISRDVTAEVEARLALEQSLGQKDLLLQEVHHRVKNNLSILGSLMELQGVLTDDAKMRNILRDTQNRILSVARVHEALTSTGAIGCIDLADYVSRLGTELREAYGGQGVEVDYELTHYQLSQHRAIHFGLLVNELISNAFKHAFPGTLGRLGKVQVFLRKDADSLELTVQDNGIGLPLDFNREGVSSLGVQVVTMLTDQMRGTVIYESEPCKGTLVRVSIPGSELLIGNGIESEQLHVGT